MAHAFPGVGTRAFITDIETGSGFTEGSFQTDFSGPKSCIRKTHINDVPNAILSNIFSLISDPRTRNSMALICRDWYYLERQTRTSLSVRGNICDLQGLSMSFQQVSTLDLSLCSPWGVSLFQSITNGEEIGNTLKLAFPIVTDLTIYVRDALDIQMVAWLWPGLETVRLIRWHQRAMDNEAGMELGVEMEALLKVCARLKDLDLSKFYCWTEDIPPAFQEGVAVAANLRSLNLLKISPDGFKSQEVTVITAACPKLEELYILCQFDHRLLDSVGDETLLILAKNCGQLHTLHLVDTNEWDALRDNADDDGYASEEAHLSRLGLEAMFKALPHLEDLSFLLSQNVRNAGLALEVFPSHCKKLRSLKLSHFHGLCRGPQPDGIGLCTGLLDLCIRNCADLVDSGLEAISIGCCKLRKLSLHGCKLISDAGLHTCVKYLSRSLQDVEVSCCQLLPTAYTLQALDPIRATLIRLHVDCIWDACVPAALSDGIGVHEELRYENERDIVKRVKGAVGFGTTGLETGRMQGGSRQEINFGFCGANISGDRMAGTMEGKVGGFLLPDSVDRKRKRVEGIEDGGSNSAVKFFSREFNWGSKASGSDMGQRQEPDGAVGSSLVEEHMFGSPWCSLRSLSLWIPVGESITPLPSMGLWSCPVLEQLSIRVEGDCRLLPRPATPAWGIGSFARYPRLANLHLDLREVVGYSMSAPLGVMDLDFMERHFLTGVQSLHLSTLDYWPPSDKEVNRRGLSLPAVGLLSQCSRLRKLFIHGTTHEHFLMMLVRCENLRDVQLRGDYYPAPEYETSTELRTISCQRFETAVAKRGFPD